MNHSTSMINHGRISDKNGFLMGYFMASPHEKFREMIHEIIMNLSKCMKIWGELNNSPKGAAFSESCRCLDLDDSGMFIPQHPPYATTFG